MDANARDQILRWIMWQETKFIDLTGRFDWLTQSVRQNREMVRALDEDLKAFQNVILAGLKYIRKRRRPHNSRKQVTEIGINCDGRYVISSESMDFEDCHTKVGVDIGNVVKKVEIVDQRMYKGVMENDIDLMLEPSSTIANHTGGKKLASFLESLECTELDAYKIDTDQKQEQQLSENAQCSHSFVDLVVGESNQISNRDEIESMVTSHVHSVDNKKLYKEVTHIELPQNMELIYTQATNINSNEPYKKTKLSKTERVACRALDKVEREFADELQMEDQNKDFKERDVMLDMSDAEQLCLYVEEHPSNYVGPYPIICESPCNGDPLHINLNSEYASLGDLLRYRLCNEYNPDDAIRSYIFNLSLCESEILVASDKVVVRRSHLLSLRPHHLVETRIINAMVHFLTLQQRANSLQNIKYWWIPTKLTRPDRTNIDVLSETSMWEDWVGPLSHCEKIYMPMLVKLHWILIIIDMRQKTAFVCDNLRISSIPLVTAIMDSVLKSMDIVFKDEIKKCKDKKWRFDQFAVLEPVFEPFSSYKHCVGENCGVNVIKGMQAAYNNGVSCIHGTAEEERLCLAMQLCTSEYNTIMKTLGSRAIQSDLLLKLSEKK